MSQEKTLIIARDSLLRTEISEFLRSKGFDATGAQDGDESEIFRLSSRPGVVILDCSPHDGNVIEMMRRLRRTDPFVVVILLAEAESMDLAVQALEEGADHFLSKPANLTALSTLVQRAAKVRRNCQRRDAERALLDGNQTSPFLGTSAAIRKLSELAHRAADSESSILIVGETGTGKGLLARWIHDHSPRSSDVFTEVKCGASTGRALELELLGQIQNDDAVASRGLMELADKGTLFLDEISELNVEMQQRLLPVLEAKQFRSREAVNRNVDLRVISATHRDMATLVQEEKFRSDLYFAISTISLSVPSLRDRVEDIEPLTRHFAQQLAKEMGVPQPDLSQGAISALQAYSWPGNVRELRILVEHAILVSRKDLLTERDFLLDSASASMSHEGFARTLQQVQRQYIEQVLFREGWRVEAAAKKLGMPRSSLYQKIKEFNIPRPAHQSHIVTDRRLQN